MNPNAVLLVEDHPLVSMMLADMLTEHAPDMGVIKVPTIQACEQHVHENPRLVIFDLNLPDCMGVDSAKRVRDLFPFAQLLAFTGTAHDNILQELSDLPQSCLFDCGLHHSGCYFVIILHKPSGDNRC